MKITVNEEVMEVGEQADLIQVLAAVNVEPDKKGIAVAINDRVVRRADWHGHAVSAGDRIEIIQATQGG